MEIYITKMNSTSENITYLVDKKKICVNITNFTHLQQEEENGFQKQCMEMLKNHSA